MKQVVLKGGVANVEDVPAPICGSRTLLVRTRYSCISAGTEMAGLKASGMPLYRRALKHPEHVRRVISMVKDEGIRRTYNKVRGKLAGGIPAGYSVSGEVIGIGNEIEGFSVGDLVGCGGANMATHSEIVNVPVNLCVKLPAGLDLGWASTMTVGSIALQGVRRTAPQLGETIVVIGLGVLGQLTVQILKASGCTVIGVDLDTRRIELAKQNGLQYGVNPADGNYIQLVQQLTDGFGADAAVITAASSSDKIVSEAMQSCRKRGRVVLVGDVGLGLRREDMYAKELDLYISCSYGPGRYDPVYEEVGQDYPLPYVRWTENRNMAAYLQLLANGRVDLTNLIDARYKIDDAAGAYASLESKGEKPIIVLLEYPDGAGKERRRIQVDGATQVKGDRISVALIGAGSFAQGVHLPNLMKLRKMFHLKTVMSGTGANAASVAKSYEAEIATTDLDEVLGDDGIDLVLISTRHNLHGEMVIRALEAGKSVFVEKPLCLTTSELDRIGDFYASTNVDAGPVPLLMVGFNRRFAPALVRAREILKNRTSPMILNYRMNAGHIPGDHWVHGPEGGGRNIGEACHIYDIFNYLTGAEPVAVSASGLNAESRHWKANDNFVATVKYGDGSVCTLTYTALGDRKYPKERMDLFCNGMVLSLDNYKKLSVSGSKTRGWSNANAQKGHVEELEALGNALQKDAQWPISLADQIAATEISFAVEDQLRKGVSDS